MGARDRGQVPTEPQARRERPYRATHAAELRAARHGIARGAARTGPRADGGRRREPGRASPPSSGGLRPHGQHRVQELRRTDGVARLSPHDHGGRNLIRRGAASRRALRLQRRGHLRRAARAQTFAAGLQGRAAQSRGAEARRRGGAYRPRNRALPWASTHEGRGHRGRLPGAGVRRRRRDVRAGRAHQPGPALYRRRRRGAETRQARERLMGPGQAAHQGGGARDGLRSARHLRRARSDGGPRLRPSGLRLTRNSPRASNSKRRPTSSPRSTRWCATCAGPSRWTG